MDYSPLNIDREEIRLLTISPSNDAASSSDGLISCTVEHLPLHRDMLLDPDCETSKDIKWSFEDIPVGLTPRQCPYTSSLWRKRDHKMTVSMERFGFLRKVPIPDSPITAGGLEKMYDYRHKQRYVWGDYIALSYLWGDPNDTAEIFVNGIRVRVSKNLEAALRQLRDHELVRNGVKVWVDAICINQEDLSERAREVTRMRLIYASAQHVVVWLGVAADDSDTAMLAVRYLSQRVRAHLPVDTFYQEYRGIDLRPLLISWNIFEPPLKDEVYRALKCLFSRTYWRRLWILQELAQGSPDTPILCGTKSLRWEEFHNAALLMEIDKDRLGRRVMASGVKGVLADNFSWDLNRQRLPTDVSARTDFEQHWELTMAIMKLQKSQNQSAEYTLADAYNVLQLCRDAKTTNERDRVYGILGLKAISQNVTTIPDYKISASEVFVRFSKSLIQTGNLMALRFANSPIGRIVDGRSRGVIPSIISKVNMSTIRTEEKPGNIVSSCCHGLPSWVVCWTCPHGPIAPFAGTFRASIGSLSTPVFWSDNCLKVQGLSFDTIVTASAFHVDEVNTTYPCNNGVSESVYGGTTMTSEAFWKTLVAGTDPDGLEIPVDYSWLLSRELWGGGVAGAMTHGFGLHDFMKRNKKLQIFGVTLEQLIYGQGTPTWLAKNRSSYSPTKSQRAALAWAMDILAWRRLITTKKGHLGLVPADTRIDDIIAVLLGSDVPMVLRPCKDGYTVVGECYVHGIMYGEALVPDGAANVQTNEIILY